MRRAVSQLFSASTPGASWLAQLTASSSQNVVRSAGETSTSYSGVIVEGPLRVLTRSMSGKGKGKGGPASKAAAPPPPPPPAKNAIARDSVLASAGARLRKNRPGPEPISLLTPQQRQLAEQLMQRAAPLPGADAGASAADTAAAAAAHAASQRGLVPLGLPLDRRDVASLVDQSLSAAAGQNVHFQPFVFSNLFQSAPAAAAYVASALESGGTWPRIERFFLAAVEADSSVRGVKVMIGGRLGRKAGMATSKVWEWGEMNVMALSDRLDYGATAANTRMGAVGVKVWFRYKASAVKDVFFPPMGGSHHRTAPAAGALPKISLDELYGAAVARTTRVALPYSFSSVAWWERPAPQQPPANVSAVFAADYCPAAGDRLDGYLRRRREERRRFRSAAERRAYLATTGRFLARQRKVAQLRAAALQGGAAAAPLGRRPNRALGRVRAAAQRRSS